MNEDNDFYILLLFFSVLGFEHTPFDEYKEGWQRYSFPYKLGGYSKSLLTNPTALLTLDYTTPIQESIAPTTLTIPFIKTGFLDCVAIWVDYQLDATNVLTGWSANKQNFPSFLKTFVRFAPERTAITKSSSDTLTLIASFDYGQSDFCFNFGVKQI